ncbi:hypothetical protein WMF20_00890 [Sorangium sp. So ce834]|uniref:hypothetical protein n=1 Tax=Sorangium sp. So ce834 TaxID=3133321 RepID=UPI003F5FFA1A
MPRRRGLFLVLSLLGPAPLSAGCARPIDAPDGTAYVLLDPAARARWTVESDGWRGAPVLPVALDAAEPALLRGPGGAEVLELRGGMLAHVRGGGGEVRWLAVGEEARDDRLTVRASEAAAAALAALVDGEITARRDGLWTLAAPDLLERGSFLEPPAGVIEALPDTPRDRAAFTPSASQDALDALAAPAAAAAGSAAGTQEPGSAEAELVGLYAAGLRTLLLDASGGFTIEDRCTGAVIATGAYSAAGDRVMLRSPGAAPIVLGRDRERLLHPDLAEFAPLAPEPSRRVEPESELIERAGADAGEE